MFDESAYVHIWKGYQCLEQTPSVLRSGYRLIGIAAQVDDGEGITERFYRRGESVLEHSAKVAYLVSAFMSHFPKFFGTQCDKEASVWAIITTALLHDVGEVPIGDIPDDGNSLHDGKDAMERHFVKNHMAPAFSLDESELFLDTYDDFQQHKTIVGQALYALDKLEAVLHLIWMESFDSYGTITAKPVPTTSDLEYARITGTPCATDCWSAHIKDRLKGFPDQITEHVFGLMRTAVTDVRGEWFEWWNQA